MSDSDAFAAVLGLSRGPLAADGRLGRMPLKDLVWLPGPPADWFADTVEQRRLRGLKASPELIELACAALNAGGDRAHCDREELYEHYPYAWLLVTELLRQKLWSDRVETVVGKAYAHFHLDAVGANRARLEGRLREKVHADVHARAWGLLATNAFSVGWVPRAMGNSIRAHLPDMVAYQMTRKRYSSSWALHAMLGERPCRMPLTRGQVRVVVEQWLTAPSAARARELFAAAPNKTLRR